jgi:hypothetical protein
MSSSPRTRSAVSVLATDWPELFDYIVFRIPTGSPDAQKWLGEPGAEFEAVDE